MARGEGDAIMATETSKKKPAPAYRLKGRPVYTQEQLEEFPSRLPDESPWVEELKRKAKLRTVKSGK